MLSSLKKNQFGFIKTFGGGMLTTAPAIWRKHERSKKWLGM